MKLRLAISHISVSDVLSRFYRGDHELEFVQLRKQKNERIEVEEVIKRHDKRVSEAFERWKSATLTIALVFCFIAIF